MFAVVITGSLSMLRKIIEIPSGISLLSGAGIIAGFSYLMWYAANKRIGCARGMAANSTYVIWGVLINALFWGGSRYLRKRLRDVYAFWQGLFWFQCRIYKKHRRRSIVEGIISPEGCHSEDNYVSGRYLYRCRRLMLTNQAFYHYMYNPGSVECGGNKRRLDICVCTERLREDLIREEGMKDPYFIKLLNQKLARELFHFIRDGGRLLRTAYIEKEQKRFIERHLDFLRAVRFNYYLRKKHITVVNKK